MNIITQNKTTELLKLAIKDSNAIFVCFNQDEVDRVKALVNELYPEQYLEIRRCGHLLDYPNHFRNRNLYIDNVDLVLHYVFYGNNIQCITIDNKENITNGQ
jgi:hypothetical protein